MFDLAWSEIALIAVVALVVIGPKDLPEAVKGVARAIQKLRRMAGDFQSQVDEVAKDAGVQDLRRSINEIRNFDLKGQIAKAVDDDGSMRSTFSQNPMDPTPASPSPDTLPPAPVWTPPPPVDAPAFVPPGVAAATAPFIAPPPVFAPAPVPEAPSFVPPAFATPAEATPAFTAPVFTPPAEAPPAVAEAVPPPVVTPAPPSTPIADAPRAAVSPPA